MNDDLARIAGGLGRIDQRLASITRSTSLLRRRLASLEAAELHRRRGPGERHIPEFRSQNGEDYFLWELFGDRSPGFFIEAGAFDGYAFSVSYVFECVGWSGLLVEPIPERAAECRRRRRHSRVVHAALSRPGAPDSAEFTVMNNGEMLSYLHLSEGHRRRIARETDVHPSTATVPVTTLDRLLADHKGPIDFAVFDVEGGELDLLAGFDLDRWRPRALLIEDNSMGKDHAVAEALAPAGYRKSATLDWNDLYIREGDADLLDRIARLA